jgi:LysM repeat protein
MDEKRSSHPAEGSHSYLDVRPTGPPRWVLVVGALLVATAVLGIFYGLNALNRGTMPTPSPDLAALTLAAGTGTPLAAASTFTPSPPPPPTTPTPTSTVTATVELPTYTVQQGDSLIGIAQRLNVDVDALTALNQLGGETIFPSQVLFLPPTVTPWPETGPFPHVVSQGETLLSIAALYSVTVGELRNLNGLASDTIFVGQRILIPGSGVRPATPTPTPEPWEPAIITSRPARGPLPPARASKSHRWSRRRLNSANGSSVAACLVASRSMWPTPCLRPPIPTGAVSASPTRAAFFYCTTAAALQRSDCISPPTP